MKIRIIRIDGSFYVEKGYFIFKKYADASGHPVFRSLRDIYHTAHRSIEHARETVDKIKKLNDPARFKKSLIEEFDI